MARVDEIEQGTRAVKVIELPLANVPHGIQSGTPEQQRERELRPNAYKKREVGIRALLPCEREKILELASARAIAKGGKAEEGNPLFNHALALYTVAGSYVVPDAPAGTDPDLYFGDTIEKAAEKLRSWVHMTDDIVLYLRQCQEEWQTQISPQALSIGENELFDVTKKAAEDESFLAFMRPGMLAHFAHILAAQLLLLLDSKLSDTSTSSVSTTSA
jgi:hypothetical protein